MKAQVTTVKNLITGEKNTYANRLSLTENVVNQIMYQTGQTSDLLTESVREKYRSMITESVSTMTGRRFAFCENYDLHASAAN